MLVLVGHHEGDLGFGRAFVAVEASHGDQGAVDLGHQCQPIEVVDAGEALDLLRPRGWGGR